jgi:hypothetical protein
MQNEASNPFAITKAVDFTDDEIARTFVDFPAAGGFLDFLNPTSPMPMLILGGKGSGRTHMLRYFSYALQKKRASGGGTIKQLVADKYIGIYARCEGLNAGRFAEKGQTREVWAETFAHSFDLWLVEIVLSILVDLIDENPHLAIHERAFCDDVVKLFDVRDFKPPSSILSVLDLVRDLRRRLDIAVNNVAFTRKLDDVVIRSTRGRLVFGIPVAAAKNFEALRDVSFVYLIDELEHFLEDQQEYVNTLVREKVLPSSFKIGSRTYGMHTYKTLSGGEENREGSEYELLMLDSALRENSKYPAFAHRLVARRLVEAGYELDLRDFIDQKGDKARKELAYRLKVLFAEDPVEPPYERARTRFMETYVSGRRPYLVALRAALGKWAGQKGVPFAKSDVDKIVAAISVPDTPLVERANVLLLYQAWAQRKVLRREVENISAHAQIYLNDPNAPSMHKRLLNHFRGDLIATMLREARQPQRYTGLDTFVQMSGGRPRLLLMVLKHVYRWAVFNGDSPFGGVGAVSTRSQNDGVTEASTWFFHDARTTGKYALAAQEGVDRFATLLRRLRFTDKPVESSLTTFSAVLSECSDATRLAIRHAADSSLLIESLTGRKDRNSGLVASQFQLNPMLCPRYQLPLSRRGQIALRPEELNILFGGGTEEQFERVVRARQDRMMVPFRITSKEAPAPEETSPQIGIFDQP